MRAALTLSALATLANAAAAAPAPHGPGCALTRAECAVVLQELAADDVETIDEERAFGDPTDLPSKLALNDRHTARMRTRVARLPPRIANEFARLRACQAEDRLTLKQGTVNDDPRCH